MKRRPERDSRAANVAAYNERMAKRLPKPKRKFPRRGITVDHTSGVRLSPAEFSECFYGIVGLKPRAIPETNAPITDH